MWSSPLARSGATSSHTSQIHRIFRDARATLQLDATIASSPVGSIASRLPGSNKKSNAQSEEESQCLQPADWRYSTAPEAIAQLNLDVREPFPNKATLPLERFSLTGACLGQLPVEPASSGFASPADANPGEKLIQDATKLPVSPSPYSTLTTKFTTAKSGWSTASHVPNDFPGDLSPCVDGPTDLNQPMEQLHLTPVHTWLNNIIEGSDAHSDQATYSQSTKARESIAADMSDIDMGSPSSPDEITLTTPAKAAAESAKLKRELLGDGVWASVKNSNRRSFVEDTCDRCRCKTPTSNLLTIPTVQITPSDFLHGSPPPRPSFQQPQLPTAQQYRRADSTGSPFPLLRSKATPPANRYLPAKHWQSPHDSSAAQFASPVKGVSSPDVQRSLIVQAQQCDESVPTSFDDRSLESPLTIPQSPHVIPDSQQMIELQAAPPRPRHRAVPHQPWLEKPFYSFSTAAGAYSGSSPAPDSRIRNSYRTDTLTPFELPTTRFRKIGLGAALQKGARYKDAPNAGRRLGFDRTVSGANRMGGSGRVEGPRTGFNGARKYYANVHASHPRGRSPQDGVFRSSPPRPTEPAFGTPRRKKIRRTLGPTEAMPIMTEEDEIINLDGIIPRKDSDLPEVPGKSAVSHPEKTEPAALLDEDSPLTTIGSRNERMVVRETITARPRQTLQQTCSYKSQKAHVLQGDEVAPDALELSPYVTPYRKGKGPKRSVERRSSYWDDDILGKHSQDGDDDKENEPPPVKLNMEVAEDMDTN